MEYRGEKRAGVGQGGACSRQNQQLEAEPGAGTSSVLRNKTLKENPRDRKLFALDFLFL